ncbi:hypothetical protein Bhyg_11943 [Pseudolycoriella hygida]|uniref:DDE-1 domain-containing protein n=1 Tax=Pseudolycoriella hygida TaxID=35572 RepID=A0A9Q0MWD4_9DIPT|nr:hypothetical protein Bhyg_11943 [Pseudolycoriella hygida]
MKRVSRREMGPPKANTTVTYAFSAAGDYVEPLITLKDSSSSVAEIAFALGSVGANYGINQTESGWTKTESFYYFLSIHLHNQWEEKNCPKPRILTIDGYGAHFSAKLFRWCRSNAVIIIVLYPGATPYMQMCDTTMFSPMKHKHTQLYSQWRLKNPTKTMNDAEFVKILKQINDAVIKKDSIINGWRATGLQPFNFNNLNTDGLLSKSSDRTYDFKGYCLDSTSESMENTTVYQTKVDGLSSTILNPSFEHYITHEELSTVTHPEAGLLTGENNDHFNQPTDVHLSTVLEQSKDNSPLVELVNINAEDIPEGPIGQEIQLKSAGEMSYFSVQPNNETGQVVSIPIEPSQNNNCVAFSELCGPSEIYKSQSETRFDLSSFGLSAEGPNAENTSKMGKLVDKIRLDVKRLGMLCAASAKEKLINILVINQQLNIIDPPLVAETDTTEEHRTIKSVLKPPTMPQRCKRKRNMSLKVSYGVVTAKEVVQSIMERESAKERHEIECEKSLIAKHERENEITAVEEEAKDVRKLLNASRTELLALNKDMVQYKKSKAVKDCSIYKVTPQNTADDLQLLQATKREKEIAIMEYDKQLRELRVKLKSLKVFNVEANKADSVKKKKYELQRKQIGNKVQPSVMPHEVDETEMDSEIY